MAVTTVGEFQLRMANGMPLEEVLRTHAHELAEKIRAESHCGDGCEYYFADLIDPEVD